jgi:hypothetical protein
MKLLVRPFTVLLGLTTCIFTPFSLPASADSTADLLITLNCQSDYTVNIWRRYGSGELLYRATGPLGNLGLGKVIRENTGAAQVYKFKNSNYIYQVLSGKKDHQ